MSLLTEIMQDRGLSKTDATKYLARECMNAMWESVAELGSVWCDDIRHLMLQARTDGIGSFSPELELPKGFALPESKKSAALYVVCLDPNIREWLEKNDPKALAQCEEAIK